MDASKESVFTLLSNTTNSFVWAASDDDTGAFADCPVSIETRGDAEGVTGFLPPITAAITITTTIAPTMRKSFFFIRLLAQPIGAQAYGILVRRLIIQRDECDLADVDQPGILLDVTGKRGKCGIRTDNRDFQLDQSDILG